MQLCKSIFFFYFRGKGGPRFESFPIFFTSLLRGADFTLASKLVSEYDQELPQSQTADNPMEPRRRGTQLSRDTRKTN